MPRKEEDQDDSADLDTGSDTGAADVDDDDEEDLDDGEVSEVSVDDED